MTLAALNNVETQDAYEDATTLRCEGATKLSLEVNNAAIFYRYSVRRPGGGGALANWGPEVFKGPGTYLLARNAEAVQIRSAVAGKPAQVTIEALGQGE